ncbi:hypothetical protein [Oleispirillum naphthae]|uniref:hypothetical protein n=1 Tax=Oleispirillum naphthae TaxID=2838853 RepID=UPI0030826558
MPAGDTVDRRLRSLMEHPLYHDPADDRLRAHVTQEFARAYPDAEAYDAAGRTLRSGPAIRDAEEQNRGWMDKNFPNQPGPRDKLAALKEGQSLTHPLTRQNKDINADGFNDLHYASGKSNLDTTATLTFTRDGGNIRVEGDQAHRWRDVYDWQKDTSFLGGLVTGDEMLVLENQGKAKPFDMHGEWGGPPVSGRIPIGDDGSLGEPEIDWSGGKQ